MGHPLGLMILWFFSQSVVLKMLFYPGIAIALFAVMCMFRRKGAG